MLACSPHGLPLDHPWDRNSVYNQGKNNMNIELMIHETNRPWVSISSWWSPTRSRNRFRPGHNGYYFTDNIFKCIFMNEIAVLWFTWSFHWSLLTELPLMIRQHWVNVTVLKTQLRASVPSTQLRAAGPISGNAARAQIRSTIGSMGPQKPNEQYIERTWRSQRSQRSWCSCAQPTQPAQPELQFEVL